MAKNINLRAASVSEVMAHLGDSVREHIRQKGSLRDFVVRSGVPAATLYRFFDGGNIGIDNFIRILRALNKMDLLIELTKAPELSPIDLWNQQAPSSKKLK